MMVQRGMTDVSLTTGVNKSVDFSWIGGWLRDVRRRDPCINMDVFPSYAISILMRSHAAGAHARNSWTGGRRGRKVKRGGREGEYVSSAACTQFFCGKACRRFRHSLLSESQNSQCCYCPHADPFHMTHLNCTNPCRIDRFNPPDITPFAIVLVGNLGLG